MLTVDQLEDKLIDLAFAEDIGDGDHTTWPVLKWLRKCSIGSILPCR